MIISPSFILLGVDVILISKFLYVFFYISGDSSTVLWVFNPVKGDIPPKVLTKFCNNANFSVINSNSFNSFEIEEEEDWADKVEVKDRGGDKEGVVVLELTPLDIFIFFNYTFNFVIIRCWK